MSSTGPGYNGAEYYSDEDTYMEHDQRPVEEAPKPIKGLGLAMIGKLKAKFGRKALLSRLAERRDLVTAATLYPWTLRIAIQPLAGEEGAFDSMSGGGGDLVLGAEIVTAFGRVVGAKLQIFAKTIGIKDDRIAVFTRSLKFLNFIFNAPGFSAARLAQFKDLILLVGDAVAKETKGYIQEEYPDGLTDEEHDALFLQVMDLFMSSLREAIYSVDPQSQLVSHPDLRFYKSQLARFLRSTSAIQEEAETQSGSGVRLSDWCRVLFGTDVDAHNRECVDARRVATKKNLLLDVKSYLLKLDDPASYLGVYEDEFSSPTAYQNWLKSERKYATGLINTLLQKFPDLQTAVTSTTLIPPPSQPSVFVPPDPPTYYRLLLLLAVNHDAPSYPEDLLSPFSKQLLVECAIRWRISSHLRELTFAECMLNRFSHSDLGREIRFSALCRVMKRTFGKLLRERAASTSEDLDNLLHLLVKSEEFFRQHFLANFSDSLSPSASSAEDVIDSFEILERIYSDPLFQKHPSEKTARGESPREILTDLLLQAINDRYKSMETEISSEETRDLSRVVALAKTIRMEVNAYVWRYPDPLLGTISVAGFATSTYLNFFVLEMENLRHSPDMANGDYTIAEMLELYQIVRILKDLGSQEAIMAADIAGFDVEVWFEPFVTKWLSLTDKKVDEWVGGSVSVDKFRPILAPTNMQSSSVVDIFAIFHQALDFIDQLRWPNEVTKGSFLCGFVKVMSKALEKYSGLLIQPFLDLETTNKSPDFPVEITPEFCTRINNLFDCYKRFEDIVEGMDIQHYSQLYTSDLAGGRSANALREGFHYRIDILRARDLNASARSEDYYVKIMSPNPGNRSERQEISRTAVIEDCTSGDPTWNHSVIVSVPPQSGGTIELDICLYDREKYRSDKLRGDTKLLLMSSDVPTGGPFSADAIIVPNLDDYLPQEVVIPLDANTAKLWVRVQREGADADSRTDNDIRYWAVRTALGLEEALTSAVRVLSEQTIRHARRNFWKAFNSLLSKPSLDPESLLASSLAYWDSVLGTINMYSSKAVGKWLFENRGLLSIEQVEDNTDPTSEAPNLLALFIWADFLNSLRHAAAVLTRPSGANPIDWAKKMFSSSKGDANVKDRQHRLAVLLREIELAKAVMYCEVEDLHYGFDVSELELGDYAQLQTFVRAA